MKKTVALRIHLEEDELGYYSFSECLGEFHEREEDNCVALPYEVYTGLNPDKALCGYDATYSWWLVDENIPHGQMELTDHTARLFNDVLRVITGPVEVGKLAETDIVLGIKRYINIEHQTNRQITEAAYQELNRVVGSSTHPVKSVQFSSVYYLQRLGYRAVSIPNWMAEQLISGNVTFCTEKRYKCHVPVYTDVVWYELPKYMDKETVEAVLKATEPVIDQNGDSFYLKQREPAKLLAALPEDFKHDLNSLVKYLEGEIDVMCVDVEVLCDGLTIGRDSLSGVDLDWTKESKEYLCSTINDMIPDALEDALSTLRQLGNQDPEIDVETVQYRRPWEKKVQELEYDKQARKITTAGL